MANVMNEYLVALGWKVDHAALREFDNALNKMSQAVERYTNNEFYGIVPKFTKAGAAIVGALAAISAGTVGLLSHTARADLDFQVLARRMFMSADAAKQMKIATDALGYSLEEIIYGPAELQERYHTLIEDQRRMSGNLGAIDFEHQMVKLREVGFEFTRFEVELQYFGMQLAGTIAKALFGDKGDLLENLKSFNLWFQNHIPEIADKVSKVLVPVLKEAYHVLQGMVQLLGFLHSDNKWGQIWDKDKSFNGNMNDLFGINADDTSKTDIISKTAQKGRALGGGNLGAAELLALFDMESGFNPNARNKRTGAMGLGQIMPFNWPRGKRVDSTDDQVDAGGSMFFGLLNKYKGNVKEALHDYYGRGTPGPGEPSFDEYYNNYQRFLEKWKKDPAVDPSYYHPMSFGGATGNGGTTINVNVASSNAGTHEIAYAVRQVVEDLDRKRNQRLAAQMGGIYA